MKRVSLLLALTVAVFSFAAAQTQTRERRSGESRSAPSSESTAVRGRTVVSNHSEKKPNADSANLPTTNPDQPAWGNTAIASPKVASEVAPTRKPQALSDSQTVSGQNSGSRSKLVQPTAMISEAPSVRLIGAPANTSPRATEPASAPAYRAPVATMLYRVGVGDVLDIRLTNMPTRDSTLFTVLNSGVVEHPLLSGTVTVAGLTTEEIAALLTKEIKVIDHPKVVVAVRDYSSHAVTISGAVDSPGRKILRREVAPLYVVLAEALPRPEASVVTIVHDGKNQTLSMTNTQAMSAPVMSGDVIRVSSDGIAPKRYIYVGGDVASAGEKEFREGMTLTQALLTAGGVARGAKVSAKVARRNASGFLVTNEYNVSAIQEGRVADPILQAGDRIEVIRGM